MPITPSRKRAGSDLDDGGQAPISNAIWWNKTCFRSVFERNLTALAVAEFIHARGNGSEPIANIVILTDVGESFLRYSDLIKSLYDSGFNIFTYDHQGQGLSESRLDKIQLNYVDSFEDYVDDLIVFIHEKIHNKDRSKRSNVDITTDFSVLPTYLLGHGLGGLIGSLAMSKSNKLIDRAVLTCPMFRSKCSTMYFNYEYPIPQPLVYWGTWLANYVGLGTAIFPGFHEENLRENLPLNVTTSDHHKLMQWQHLRRTYPKIARSALTCNWLLEAIKCQKSYSQRYDVLKTNTLIISAEHDKFVWNKAMTMFCKANINYVKALLAKNAYHDILFEKPEISNAVEFAIKSFFTQEEDEIKHFKNHSTLFNEKTQPVFSTAELIFRLSGFALCGIGFVTGCAMLMSDGSSRKAIK